MDKHSVESLFCPKLLRRDEALSEYEIRSKKNELQKIQVPHGATNIEIKYGRDNQALVIDFKAAELRNEFYKLWKFIFRTRCYIKLLSSICEKTSPKSKTRKRTSEAEKKFRELQIKVEKYEMFVKTFYFDFSLFQTFLKPVYPNEKKMFCLNVLKKFAHEPR